jgi:hypothetical protein
LADRDAFDEGYAVQCYVVNVDMDVKKGGYHNLKEHVLFDPHKLIPFFFGFFESLNSDCD